MGEASVGPQLLDTSTGTWQEGEKGFWGQQKGTALWLGHEHAQLMTMLGSLCTMSKQLLGGPGDTSSTVTSLSHRMGAGGSRTQLAVSWGLEGSLQHCQTPPSPSWHPSPFPGARQALGAVVTCFAPWSCSISTSWCLHSSDEK